LAQIRSAVPEIFE